jgi:hypothetical protein
MHGIGQDPVVHIERDGIAIYDLVNVFVLVALHTGIIRYPGLDLWDIHHMGRMAGRAGRNNGGILFPEFPLDYFLMRFFDPDMAFHTGFSNPVCRYGRIRTGMWQNQVIAMTIVAGGSYDKSRFKQSPAVDPLGIVFHDVVLGDIIDPGHNLPFPVTPSAEIGDIHFIST